MQPASPALAGCFAACFMLASITACSSRHSARGDKDAATPVLNATATRDPEVAAFYRDGHNRLWTTASAVKPEADIALSLLARAPEHGLDPARYQLEQVEAAVERARSGDAAAIMQAEILLSDAYASFAQDVRRPPNAPSVFYVDGGLKPMPISKRQMLETLAAAPSLAGQLAANDRMNPLYDALRHRLSLRLKQGDGEQTDVLRAELDRTRLLPMGAAGRYVVVDAASATLWMVENGRVADTMRVIVGKPGQATPMMAGLIRFAVLNPYWHIPPDLVPARVASRVLRDGPQAVERDRLEIVSEWGPEGRRIEPKEVDWRAVAAGTQRLRVRQLPGGRNVMGSVKFMMPNRLGIYLHDTPDKLLFERADRRLSSGCVRVADAARLQRWLFAGRAPTPSGAPEERAYLPRPVPVYITYLTGPSPTGAPTPVA